MPARKSANLLDDDFTGRRLASGPSHGGKHSSESIPKADRSWTTKKIPHHPTPKRIGRAIIGNSQADLFANSGFALFDVMADVDKIEVKERLPLEVEGSRSRRIDGQLDARAALSLSGKRLSA